MRDKLKRFSIGLRTIKTSAAIVISMAIVDAYGASSARLIFAMLGALTAVQPSFKESVKACLTQVVGVFFGCLVGVFLLTLPISHFAATGIGVILIIVGYNGLRITFPPSLPCIVLVNVCTTASIQPFPYAMGRLWDTAIGLAVGMVINTLIFPYDNRRKIRAATDSLERELLLFLEDMFDGDTHLPDPDKMSRAIVSMDQQLKIFASQRLLPMRPSRYRRELTSFQTAEEKARQLVVHMEVLSRMGIPGRLSPENRQRLTACGAEVRDPREPDTPTARDVVTNYHVEQILLLRRELMDALEPQATKG